MDASELYITLTAVQGELQNAMTELLAMFCVEHKDGGSKNARQAFSNILKKCKDLEHLDTMNHAFNKNKLYDTLDDGSFVLRDEINLKIIDSLFVFDALKNIRGFPAHQEKLVRRRRLVTCKQALHQQCCLACNHKCAKCDRKECKDETCHPGKKCNQHPCRNCDEVKEVCLLSSSVCCKKCNTCFYCGSKLKLDPADRCHRLRLVQGINVLRQFRQLLESLTFDDCRLLLNGTQTLPGFVLCRSMNELCQTILEAYKDVLNFATQPEHFSKQSALSQKDLDEKLNNVSAIFKHKDTESLLFTQQEEILKALGFLNESKVESSNEYNSVMKQIEGLNEEKYHRERSEVLVDRANSFNEQDKLSTSRQCDVSKDIRNSNSDVTDTLTNESDKVTKRKPASTRQSEEHKLENTDNNNNQTNEISIQDGTQAVVKESKSPATGNTQIKPQAVEIKSESHTGGDTQRINEAVEKIVACVEEIRLHSESATNELQKESQSVREEQSTQKAAQDLMNERLLGQLSAVMDKLVGIESERKESREEQKKELEEIKKNQKNLMDFIQAQQTAKASKKQGIFGHKKIH